MDVSAFICLPLRRYRLRELAQRHRLPATGGLAQPYATGVSRAGDAPNV